MGDKVDPTLNNNKFEPSHERKLETYRSMVSYAQGMMRSGLLLNGGGMLSAMTFLGNSKADNLATYHAAFLSASACFAVGLILSALSNLSAYATQFTYYNESESLARPFYLSAKVLRNTTLLMVLGSIIAFALGVMKGILLLQP